MQARATMSSREWQAEYKRRRRAEDPAYAQRSREQSLAAKRRRRGVCAICGGETKYNGKRTNGPSTICGTCFRSRQHAERRWTPDTIIRSFQRFRDATGRTPRALDAHGPHESLVLRISGKRIHELEKARELGLVLPNPQTVRREFGSWDAAILAAGMEPSRGGGGTHRPRLGGS